MGQTTKRPPAISVRPRSRHRRREARTGQRPAERDGQSDLPQVRPETGGLVRTCAVCQVRACLQDESSFKVDIVTSGGIFTERSVGEVQTTPVQPVSEEFRPSSLAVGNVYKCHGGGKTRYWVVAGIAGASVALLGVGRDGHVSSATAYGRHVYECTSGLFKPRTCVGKLIAIRFTGERLELELDIF